MRDFILLTSISPLKGHAPYFPSSPLLGSTGSGNIQSAGHCQSLQVSVALRMNQDDLPGGHPCSDLNLAVSDARFALGDQSCTLNWVDNRAERRVGDGATLRDVPRGAGPVSGKVQGVAIGDVFGAELVGCECRNDVKRAIFDKRVVC
jgi:hypothetical protein